MKIQKTKRIKLLIGPLVTVFLIATPVLAGMLNIFQSGETISSSQVNSNFATLQDQIENICEIPGQVIWSALVLADGTLSGKEFLCPGLNFTVSRQNEGTYLILREGISPEDFIINITPQFATNRICAPEIVDVPGNPQSIIVNCEIAGGGPNPSDSNFYIVLFRR